MDTALDNIRLGDNVVWRVEDLDEDRLLGDIVKIVDMSDQGCTLYHDLKEERLLITTTPD